MLFPASHLLLLLHHLITLTDGLFTGIEARNFKHRLLLVPYRIRLHFTPNAYQGYISHRAWLMCRVLLQANQRSSCFCPEIHASLAII